MAHTERVTFSNSRDESLSARIEYPLDGHVCAWAIFAHCFTCSKNLKAARQIAAGLTRHGVAVMRFDFTGLGQSEGDFAETTFGSDVEDLRTAARWLEAHHGAPTLLIGHSLGGAAALHAARDLASVKAVATIAAPYDPEHVTEMFAASIDEIREEGHAEVTLGGRPFTITKEFIEDLEAHDPEEIIGSLRKALLVLHAPRDQTVGVENASSIFGAARHPKSFISLDDADHLLTDPEDAEYVGEVIARWADRYVAMAYEESHHDAPDLRDRQVVTQTGAQRFHTDVRMGAHGLVADEPKQMGGKGHGPSPYDLLMAALGTCTSMTLRMYADRKEWSLEEVSVRLDHQKIHEKDLDTQMEQEEGEGTKKRGAKIDHITRYIDLVGDLSEDQRARLMEIADRCPVHRTLHSEVKVTTQREE